MLTPTDLVFGAVKEGLRFLSIFVCWFAIIQVESVGVAVALFLGVFFISFPLGVFEASVWDNSTPDSIGRPLLYLGLLFTGAFYIAINPIAGGALAFVFILTVWEGYHAEVRFENGEQPYQKYDWVPQNPMKFPLIPYYYYHAYKEYRASV